MSPAQHLQEAALAMVAAAQRSRSVVAVLKQRCPHIYRQIIQDGRCPDLLRLWGRCLNVDENVGQTIVHPAILEAIGTLAGVPMRGRVVHAGLQHSYGYLFSLIETPYGFKRDRWLSTAMERAFGLELSLLGDRPKEGTLLANLTWFLGQFVFRDRHAMLRRLAANASAVAPALVLHDFGQYRKSRIVEQVVLREKQQRTISLITDLIPYPQQPKDPGAENTLLAYSISNGARTPSKLITTFPVSAQVARELQAAGHSRRKVEVRPRYNAYVRGLEGRGVFGRCSVASS